MIIFFIVIGLFAIAEFINLITPFTTVKEGIKPLLVKYYKGYVVLRPIKYLHIHISSVKKVICLLQMELEPKKIIITFCNWTFILNK